MERYLGYANISSMHGNYINTRSYKKQEMQANNQ
jgi:hypothetical protein